MANCQITEKELCEIYISTETNRILGIGKPGMIPFLGAEGYRVEIPTDAIQMGKWFDKYRAQEQEEAEQNEWMRTQKEKPVRDALRNALKQRRMVVGPEDRAYIDHMLRIMDKQQEDSTRRMYSYFAACEAYEAGKDSDLVALDSPFFKQGKRD